MLRPRGLALFAACGALLMPYIASAATVARVSGDVLVSNGTGFAPVNGDAELASGGRVLVQPGGVAMITYPGDCAVRVGAGIWSVQSTAPCTAGNHQVDFTGRMNDGMEVPVSPPPPPPVESGWLTPGTALLIGGGVVAAGLLIGCVADWCTGKSSSQPASP